MENIVKNKQLFEIQIWLTTDEAAQYLRVSPGALRVMVYRGSIKPYKLGRRSRFKREELDKLLESSIKKEIRNGN
jgi:excisionase family DNA binding protein